MNQRALATLLLLVDIAAGQTKPAHAPTPKPETPHLRFVKGYLRELIEDEGLKATGEKELSEAKTPNEQFSTGIYVSKSIPLELRSQIAVIDISSQFVAGPKPGVDYPALAPKVPGIRAELHDARKAVFDAAALVFMTLIDQKPDSQGHVSHLLISKAEKADLQDQLDITLKDEPDKGDHDYYVSAAMVLRCGLQTGRVRR